MLKPCNQIQMNCLIKTQTHTYIVNTIEIEILLVPLMALSIFRFILALFFCVHLKTSV